MTGSKDVNKLKGDIFKYIQGTFAGSYNLEFNKHQYGSGTVHF